MKSRCKSKSGTHRIQVIAWRRGASGRSSARGPCPQVPQCHPRVAKGRKSVPLTGLRSGLRPGSARRPCPQVLQRHSGVAKGASDRSSARLPCPQVPQRHPRVARRVFWPVFGPSGGQHIRRTRGYAASGPQVCIFSAREYAAPVRPPAYSVGPGIFIECPGSVALVDIAGWTPGIFSDPRHIHRPPLDQSRS